MRMYRKFLCVFLSLIILCGTLSSGIYANSESENTGQNSAERTGRTDPPTRTVYHYYIAAYQNGDLLTCTGFGNAPYMSRYTDGNSNSHFYQKWELVSSGTPGYYYIYPIGDMYDSSDTMVSLTTNDINDLSANELDNLKVVCLGSCYCGQGGASANNIVNSIYDKGADFVIGFTSGLYVGEGQIWVKTFLKGLIPNDNYYFSIRDADYAVAFAMHSNIEACDVYNRLIRGDVYSSIDE